MNTGTVSLCADKKNVVEFLLSQKFERYHEYNNNGNNSSSHVLRIYSLLRTLSSSFLLILRTV